MKGCEKGNNVAATTCILGSHEVTKNRSAFLFNVLFHIEKGQMTNKSQNYIQCCQLWLNCQDMVTNAQNNALIKKKYSNKLSMKALLGWKHAMIVGTFGMQIVSE